MWCGKCKRIQTILEADPNGKCGYATCGHSNDPNGCPFMIVRTCLL